MKRRDTLKALGLSGFGLGLAVGPAEAAVPAPPTKKPPLKTPGGRQPAEAERDAKLMAERFFTPAELATVTRLCDIILPADARSGNASAAGVPAFIEFMMKDQPTHQTPMRGGLAWLDNQSRKRFGGAFVALSPARQLALVELIAYPGQTKPEHRAGAAFFTLLRNFTLTGFYTSKIGIADLGYAGNVPNTWDGPPDAVLKQYGLL